MWKKIALLAITGGLILPVRGQERGRFSGQKAVEAYQVNPGLLAMPRYAEDGQVCEIGLQSQLYFPEKVSVDAELSSDRIEHAFDELVPIAERGPELHGFQAHPMVEVGNTITTTTQYKNVSLEIVGKVLRSNGHEVVEQTVVAVIHWKHRQCK